MSLLFTKPLPLGFKAPDFELADALSGTHKKLNDIKGSKGTLVMIICNHCPYVKHIVGELSKLARHYQTHGIGVVAISPNDALHYPEDSFDNMRLFAEQQGFSFPYLYDESQEVAKAYDAVCTPEFNLFDSDLSCVYRGQFDSSRPGNNLPLNGSSLREAIDNLLAHKPPLPNQIPSSGCSIKWKP